MEQLEQIPIGQQANDGTGDPLRNGMAKVNANFTKVQTGVDAVELTAMNAAQTATEAKTTADAAIPAAQKGMAGGVAPLDVSGKVPATHLPEQGDYIAAEEKGAADGVAPLGADGKVPAVNLPAAEDSIPLSQKGQPGGVATLDTGGKVPADQLPPIPTGPPAGSVAWWPLRSSIPAGQIPADGQTVSRATFPDLAAMVLAGTVPVATESDWLADPRNRGCYTLGDGSTTIRVPDLNGRSADSLGRVFLSGDGTDSNGVGGVIQRDQFQKHHHYINIKTSSGGADVYGQSNYGAGSGPQYSSVGEAIQFDPQVGPPRSGNKTHPQNVTGVWTIQAFGAVTNPGSADAAQLASDYAVLNAAVQSLASEFHSLQANVMGVGQSLVDVTATRFLAVVYTNTTGRPIYIYVYCISTAANGYAILSLNEAPVGQVYYPGTSGTLAFSTLIPPGATYRVNVASATLSAWREYR
ncbi:phage tail protein [Achromobacter xylosoxidans]